ncbi:MAG TPA: response regulator transcription factor [Burkholderiales bacterium]|nr:response regulator transcription factor [Burkholderiales bacterium]
MSVRLMLVDDHKMLREALRAILEKTGDFEVVAEADDGPAAIELARELSPDVVLMDIGLVGMSGIEATRRILAQTPTVKVLALSTFADRRIMLQMLQAGASGYVVKSAGSEELLHGIRAVARGETYLYAEATAALVDSLRKHSPQGVSSETLGRREREVLQLLARGKTSAQIAEILNIATGTVEVHRRNIMRKLDLHNVAELTRYAIREGLTSA